MNVIQASADFFGQRFYHNSLSVWITAICAFAILVPGFVVLKRILLRWVKRMASRTPTDLDLFLTGVVSKIYFVFLFISALAVASLFLELPERISVGIHGIFVIALWIQVGFWGTEVIRVFLNRVLQRRGDDGKPDPSLKMTLNVLEFICRLILFVFIVLLILDDLGFNVKTLIAGLGVGGIAVALAVQNVLGDLFASLSIVLDKPFVLGDFIVLDKDEGFVEKIGLKTTRLRALSGEEVICANADLVRARIRNLKRMRERRVSFHVRLKLDVSEERLARIPMLLKEIIEAQKNLRFDRAHFKGIGDFFFDFEVVYYVQNPDIRAYIEAENGINLEIVRRFRKENIELAHNP